MPTRFTHYFLLLVQLLATRRYASTINIDGATAYWHLTNVLRHDEPSDLHGPLGRYRQAIKVAY